VAAVIQAADRSGIAKKIPGVDRLRLAPFDEEEDELTSEEYAELAAGLANLRDEFGDEVDFSPVAELIPVRNTAQASRGNVRTNRSRQQRGKQRPKSTSAWQRDLAKLRSAQAAELAARSEPHRSVAEDSAQLWYLLLLEPTRAEGLPNISLRQRKIKKNGQPSKLLQTKITKGELAQLPDSDDRWLLGMLVGNEVRSGYGYNYHGISSYSELRDFSIAPAMFDALLPRLCATARFGWLPNDGVNREDDVTILAWDDGPPWQFQLEVNKTPDARRWRFGGVLRRGDEVADLGAPLLLLAHGLVIFADRIARLDVGPGFSWIAQLRNSGPLEVPVSAEPELIEQLATMPAPPTHLPAELSWQEQQIAPIACLKIVKPKQGWYQDLECHLTFQYGDDRVRPQDDTPGWYDRKSRTLVRRDPQAEAAARKRLQSAGAKRERRYNSQAEFFLTPAKLQKLVMELSIAGWQVEAEGRQIRQPGAFQLSVTSGVDWFDLTADCDFSGVKASLPQLLKAVEQGEQFVQLDDGSQGMLPDEWLKRFAPLAAMGKSEGDALRFVPTQAALLDALLAAQETDHVQVDRQFAKLRERLRSFEGIQPRDEPASFVGELRPYQRAGLGWLHFLDEFGFGGCLADDMGLGKTVQILALLEERRQARKGKRARKSRGAGALAASLVVVPRSLVFNWMEEARRFTPELIVVNYTGLERRAAWDQLSQCDVVVTTYGTLRRDIAKLRELEFDYAILDEAQAIKNAASQAAKACRLLRARRRLAITGTPVENHLGELWSLFEFLNPGMLGRHDKLNQLFASGRTARRVADDPSENGHSQPAVAPREDVALLARALRPFMLRRTKRQVLTELPPKTEQTLYCELEGDQRAKYEELREHYRRTLLARVSDVGVNKSKIHVLEALLRLRQAACHPGLLDKKLVKSPSAKLETLLEQIDEVLAEGHKALVFSQFTSLLAIVREHLDQRGVVYEYLDGRTVKRQAKVERFQSDPHCRLFLISLKAGGQGLNLTAADYVFILDPWWNPAVEAQAVDRAHRIGQDRHVFAYRLIARDTVEEKILELQSHKRDLADAIISADNSLLRNLTAEDLQLLLS
jgi:superfamily II DNA or RNA helicase